MRKPSARYTEISVDIATMIINGELGEGDRISGRSTLASKYKVSPETIRRAVTQLKDFGVVDSAPKSGIKVLSTRKAMEYIDQYHNRVSLTDLKDEITSIINEKALLENELNMKINQMINQLTHQKDIGIIYPFEADIPVESKLVGRTIGASEFWRHTGATVIGIKRDGNNYLSPGPDWVLKAGDTVVFVGKQNVYSRVIDFAKI